MDKLVTEIKGFKEVSAPEWAVFVKTGVHKERVPSNPDWWVVRAASILKKVGRYGPIGTNNLAKRYGGRKNRGHAPEKKFSASRNIVRKCLQQLTKAGLIKDNQGKAGKVITIKGKELLERCAE